MPSPFDNMPEWLRQYQQPLQQAMGPLAQGLGGVFASGVPGAGMLPPMAGAAGAIRQAFPGAPPAAAAPAPMSTPGPGGFGHDAMPRSAGMPGAMPAAPGAGMPAAPAAAPSGPSNLDPLNLIQDPRTGILMGLRQRGINPYGGNPIVNALLKRGGDIVNSSLGSIAGSNDPTGALLGALSSAIDRALSGQAVFPGGGGGGAGGAIDALQGAVSRTGSQGQNAALGDQVLASLLSNPTNAASILSDLQFGGQGQAFSSVGARQLADLASLFTQDQLQQGDATAPGFLDAYVQRRLPTAMYAR